jgi:predicted kinase
MKPIVKITTGISGSGKTTWAKEQCRINPNTIRVNRDEMRSTLFGLSLQEYFDTFNENKDKENLITSLTWKLVNEAVSLGKDIILDNTHLDIRYIRDILKNVDEDCDFEIVPFNISVDTAILRDSRRETIVGEKVILAQSAKFHALLCKLSEVSQMIEDRKKLNFEPITQNESLPKAVIFDVDGTLALMGDRSPYDWERVGEDELHEGVDLLANMCQQWNWINDEEGFDRSLDKLHVIICTGRDGKSESKTKEWLYNHQVSYDDFYIRKSGDNRKDSIVKREFLEDIVTKYNVQFVLDDRDQVVKMWRRSGIPCFQVAEGNF